MTTDRDVIDRLRQFDKEDDQSDYDEGRKAGVSWVIDGDARPCQLRRLTAWDENGGARDQLRCLDGSDYARAIFDVIEPSDNPLYDTVEFWTAILGDCALLDINFNFAVGFCNGALNEWLRLKREVDNVRE
jgi:hypothetical protein